MKKLFLIAAVSVLAYGFIYAGEVRPVPEADNSQPADIRYGGVQYSTSSFTVNHTTSVTGQAIVYGVDWSTGSTFANDFVDVWDATSVINTASNFPNVRYYNNASYVVTGATVSAGFVGTPIPYRFERGVIWRPSSSAYNLIRLLFWKTKS